MRLGGNQSELWQGQNVAIGEGMGRGEGNAGGAAGMEVRGDI